MIFPPFSLSFIFFFNPFLLSTFMPFFIPHLFPSYHPELKCVITSIRPNWGIFQILKHQKGKERKGKKE